MTGVLIKEIWIQTYTEEDNGKTKEKTTMYKPKREASEETNINDTWFQTSRLQNYKKINFCC